MEDTLRRQAEHYLCTKIAPSEWDKAKAYAERKLKGIIEREGDRNGTRQKSWYLVQLIAEIVQSNRFSRFTADFMCLLKQADKEIGIKKDSPYPKT